MKSPILTVRDVTKAFVGTVALNKVGFSLYPGEILALLGENGAGKSTLMKILSGIYPWGSFTGEIVLDGEARRFHSPKDAEDAGIAMIPQEIYLELDLSVTENIMLGKLPCNRMGLVNWSKAHTQAAELLRQLNVTDVDVHLPARSFSSSIQQLISIARALYRQPRILILDEPTSCLTESESHILFQAVRTLQEKGLSCLYISHKLNEVFDLCDRVVVLRDGASISEYPKDAFGTAPIIHDIVGRTLEDYQKQARRPSGKEILRAEHIQVAHPYAYGTCIIDDVSFTLHQGEILGLCGLVGSGRSELLGAIFGALPKQRGQLYLEGRRVLISQPSDAKRFGIGMLTEDRKKDGFIGCLSIRENISVTVLDRLTKGLLIQRERENCLARDYMNRLSIKAPDMETKILTLSGGNQQKAIVAKWLAADMKVLFLDEPTRGIDVGTKQEMYQLIRQLADSGLSIIVISSEVQELVKLCDRFLVLSGGRVHSIIEGEEASEEAILKACSDL